jgi:hypothetical protein
MKKLVLTIASVAGLSLAGYSQGTVFFDNNAANGYVVTSANGASSSAVDNTYAVAGSFNVQLFGLAGNVQSVSGLTGINAYNYLNPANLISDGFVAAGGGGAATTGSAGGFAVGAAATIAGSPGVFPFGNGNPGSTVVAVVAWTGSASTFAAALTQWQAGSIFMGILAFEQQLGPGGTSPVPELGLGWNQIPNSPNSVANGGSLGAGQDLIMTANAVPEPSTLALAGLGGFGMLMAMRRKKA